MRSPLLFTVALLLIVAQGSSRAEQGDPPQKDQAGASFVSPEQKPAPDQQIMEVEIRSVQMWCGTESNGHEVRITASNSENRNRSCESRCYYRDNHGYNGTLYVSGTVPARANRITFGSHYDSSRTFTVTNPGSFTCR